MLINLAYIFSDKALLGSMKTVQFNQAILLIQLSQHVQPTFKHHRADLICKIMNKMFDTTYDIAIIKQLLAEADGLPLITKELCGKPSERILWDVSMYQFKNK